MYELFLCLLCAILKESELAVNRSKVILAFDGVVLMRYPFAFYRRVGGELDGAMAQSSISPMQISTSSGNGTMTTRSRS